MSKEIPCQKCGHVWLWADWKRDEDAVCPNGHGCALRGKTKMNDDLVKRLKELYAQSIIALHNIEKLQAKLSKAEAKLAKAVGALGDIYDGEPEWPDEPEKELEWCRNRAKRTLAALKGQNQ